METDELLSEDALETSCFVRPECLEELLLDAPEDSLSAVYEVWGEED